jgi:hypothetical protein
MRRTEDALHRSGACSTATIKPYPNNHDTTAYGHLPSLISTSAFAATLGVGPRRTNEAGALSLPVVGARGCIHERQRIRHR